MLVQFFQLLGLAQRRTRRSVASYLGTRDIALNAAAVNLHRLRYLWLYVIVLKGFMVYISDIFTAITMLSTTSWSNAIFNSCPEHSDNGCVAIPFTIGKWLFFGCICFSFLLVGSNIDETL